jgi:hypothetical protein
LLIPRQRKDDDTDSGFDTGSGNDDAADHAVTTTSTLTMLLPTATATTMS